MSASIPTLVVDDEPLARRRMLRLLRADPDINLVGTLGYAPEAAARAPQLSPQLRLLDIRMPALAGFELVARLAEQGLNPYVIFVTAYSDRSMDAFGVGAIDYLLKPFDDERFGRAVARAKSLIASGPAPGTGAASASQPRALAAGRTRLLLSERGKVVVLAMRDIEAVQAAAEHVKIYASGRCFSFRQSLAQLESRLDPASFVRV